MRRSYSRSAAPCPVMNSAMSRALAASSAGPDGPAAESSPFSGDSPWNSASVAGFDITTLLDRGLKDVDELQDGGELRLRLGRRCATLSELRLELLDATLILANRDSMTGDEVGDLSRAGGELDRVMVARARRDRVQRRRRLPHI